MPALKKKTVVKTKQKKARSKTVSSKIEDYVNSLDLTSMYEEFANSFNDNGTQKFKTAWSYVCKMTKDVNQRKILYWMIGPEVELKSGQVPEYTLEQYDWEKKRSNGFWFAGDNIQKIQQDIHHKASAYESVREAGKINTKFIAVINKLLEQVLNEFGSGLFLPNLKTKENAFRADLLLSLIDKLQIMSSNAQRMFAQSQGLDLDRLDQFFQMFGTGMGRAAAALMGNTIDASVESAEQTTKLKQFNAVVQMVATKAAEHQLPLPDSIAEAIKATEEESKAEKPTKKAKVN